MSASFLRILRPVPLLAALLLFASACGGSGSSGGGEPPPPPPPPPPPTQAEAFKLLGQAGFGPTQAAVDEVIDLGLEGWIDAELQRPASLQLPHLDSLPPPQNPGQLQPDRVDIWFRNVLHGDDQLRQRVAFALSEIFVVSQVGALVNAPWGLADYYDMLARNAFGNYRDLMQDVTLHPSMGVYLSMLGNEKPDPARNIRPDENYARELMQLFSIGLVQLNPDGTPVLDDNDQPIPTYDQAVIEGFAHVFTGWTYAGAPDFRQARRTRNNQVVPMQLYPAFHDTGEKALLDGVVLPAGQTGEQDLAQALDTIFNHPNVGPFVAIRLIQRLVTSNPSPGYVSRVAAVFDDNGAGIRGDLAAVVKAILLDAEARPEPSMDLDGKLKEPLLRLTQLWRVYEGQSASGRYRFPTQFLLAQGPLQSPSVFNFFSPFYAPPGEIRDSGLVAPELEIATEYQNTVLTNYFFFQTFGLNQTNTGLGEDDIFIDLSEEMSIAADVDALIDLVDTKLLDGTMSAALRTEIDGMLNRLADTDTVLRSAEAVYLVVSSPEYAVQR